MSKLLSELIYQYTGRYVPPADALFMVLVSFLGCLILTFVGLVIILRPPLHRNGEEKKGS
jgi:hypothetical protein